MRVKRGDVDIAPKRLSWGWEPDSDRIEKESQTQELLGCNAGTCNTRNAPDWIRELNNEQVVDRQDVLEAWSGNTDNVVRRFA